MLFTKLAVRLGESGERFSSFCQSSISYFPAFVKRLLQFLSDFFARPVLFFEKKSRQKKLQLSGTIYRFFRLPCVKGAPPKAVRDCFFTTRLGDACKRASHTCKSLSHKRGIIKIKSRRRRRTASLRFSLLSLLSAQRFVPRRKCVKKFYKKRKIYGNKSEYMI